MPPFKDLKEILEVPRIYEEENWHSPGGRAIRDIVFGVNDGIVSTIGFLVGIAGAFSSREMCLISGLAEVLAGAVSMFFGGYLSTKSQQEFFEHEIKREKREIEEMPAKEREEIRRIYRTKGFKDADELDLVVERITSDKKIWLKCMIEEELGLILESMNHPLKVGTTVGLSFLAGGLVPLIPLIFFDITVHAIQVSVIFTAVVLFLLGALKTTLTRQKWYKSGLESLLIGMGAALIGFLIGIGLKRVSS